MRNACDAWKGCNLHAHDYIHPTYTLFDHTIYLVALSRYYYDFFSSVLLFFFFFPPPARFFSKEKKVARIGHRPRNNRFRRKTLKFAQPRVSRQDQSIIRDYYNYYYYYAAQVCTLSLSLSRVRSKNAELLLPNVALVFAEPNLSPTSLCSHTQI